MSECDERAAHREDVLHSAVMKLISHTCVTQMEDVCVFPYVSVSDQLLFVVKHTLMVPLFLPIFAAPVFLPIVHIFFVSCAPFKCQASAVALQRFG